MRSKLIRLAYEKPHLRKHLLPLLKTAKKIDLAVWGLDKLLEQGEMVLYHGSGSDFDSFDKKQTRTKLVDQYYGEGFFFVPKKRTAERYADSARNVGLPKSIIADVKRKFPIAGKALEMAYSLGSGDGKVWEFVFENWDGDTLDGLEPNELLHDFCDLIEGAKKSKKNDSLEDFMNLFNNTNVGRPEWLYDYIDDELGLDSDRYRPKVYTVRVRAKNVLVTNKESQARKAKSKGYDATIFYGSNLVDGVPEIAIYNPKNIKIIKKEIV